jgi:hypothetical protein
MCRKLQIGGAILAVAACVALSGVALAQKPGADRPPQSHPAPAPSRPQSQSPNANRAPVNTNRMPANPNRAPARPNQSPNYTNRGNHRAPDSHVSPRANLHNENRPRNNVGGAELSRRQQMGVGSARPWVDNMRDLSPQQRERVLQGSRAFESLSPDKQNKIRQQFNQWDRMTPSQRADLREKEQTWRNLTPEQRDRIKNDVLPKMRQMPWDRQQMINQKLGVLKNMPESARNQRLHDPNFTRGMTDEEKSMLHDLSHMHVGGAPEPPGE